MNSPTLAPIARGLLDAGLLRALANRDRRTLEAFIGAAIDVLDAIDGDPDREEDDPAGQADEDGVNTATPNQGAYFRSSDGPGCLLSDDDVDEVKRPLHRTAEDRERIRIRREAIAYKRETGVDDVALAQCAARKAQRRRHAPRSNDDRAGVA